MSRIVVKIDDGPWLFVKEATIQRYGWAQLSLCDETGTFVAAAKVPSASYANPPSKFSTSGHTYEIRREGA